jgi:demethylmenaquinone methyltransferase/2-methoxy-6-polyprenyl-1,4-benzoquinol methylase
MPDRLGSAFDSPATKSRYVRRLFSTIADRYDLITVLLSYGQDRRWKRRLVSMAPLAPGVRVLDLACGTGDITFALADAGARSIGLDITSRMVELARGKRPAASRPGFLVGDMMALPFGDATFDVITTGYGLRNVPVIAEAAAEMARVLRPGGVLLSLDFDRPSNPLIRAAYLGYLTIVGSALGLVLHGDPDTYRYIPESIRRYPGAEGVCSLVRERGFTSCEHVRVLGGLMALHRAVI